MTNEELDKGSWQLLVFGTNGEELAHRTHIVPAEVVLFTHEIHPVLLNYNMNRCGTGTSLNLR